MITSLSRNGNHSITVAVLLLAALLACKSSDSKSTSGEEPKPAAAESKAGKAKGDTSAAKAPAPAPAAEESDAIGTEKKWGEHSVTLKEVAVTGKLLKVALLIKNGKDEDENISSMLQFEAISDEGDKGELDLMGGNVSCDGAIPPKGLLKCKLAYKFPSPPKEVKVRVGAGMLTDAVWFKVKGQ